MRARSSVLLTCRTGVIGVTLTRKSFISGVFANPIVRTVHNAAAKIIVAI